MPPLQMPDPLLCPPTQPPLPVAELDEPVAVLTTPAAVRYGVPSVFGYLAIWPRITASLGTPDACDSAGSTSSAPVDPHHCDDSSSCDTCATGTHDSAA